MPHSKNFLLNRLSPAILNRVSSDLVVAQLAQGEVLAETHARIECDLVKIPQGSRQDGVLGR